MQTDVLNSTPASRHRERHRMARVAWLRAAVLGANDGLLLTASLIVDTELVDLARERRELASDGPAEQAELATIYAECGLTLALARQVAEQLMAKEAPAWRGGTAGCALGRPRDACLRAGRATARGPGLGSPRRPRLAVSPSDAGGVLYGHRRSAPPQSRFSKRA